jgi:hypothetical protein
VDDKEDDEKKGGKEKEAFSLLRPGVMDSIQARVVEPVKVPKIVLPDGEDNVDSTSVVPLPVASEDDAELIVVPKRGTRARLLRGTKPSPSPAPLEDDNREEESINQNVIIIAFLLYRIELTSFL